MSFHIKKGSADPFRGDWYIYEKSFSEKMDAVNLALELTVKNLVHWGNSWEEYGWEWSVFEESSNGDKKIWEGFKAISTMKSMNKNIPDVADGWLE